MVIVNHQDIIASGYFVATTHKYTIGLLLTILWYPVFPQVGFLETPFQDITVRVLRISRNCLAGHRDDRCATRIQSLLDSRVEDGSLAAALTEIGMGCTPVCICCLTSNVDRPGASWPPASSRIISAHRRLAQSTPAESTPRSNR